MYGDFSVRIERVENGYSVSMRDPKIVAANAKAEVKRSGQWRDPNRTYVFTEKEDMTEFLMENLDKALPTDTDKSFETAFKVLTESEDAAEDADGG